VFLAASGALTALLVIMPVSPADVLAAARATPLSQAGSATAGGAPGAGGGSVPGSGVAGLGAAHVVLASFPWRPLALVGALAVLVAGIVVAWRGPRWPAMSGRYSRASGDDPKPVTDTATLWESLSRGVDPTEQPGQSGRR